MATSNSSNSTSTIAQQMVTARQSGSQSSVLSLARTNPELVAQVTKLTTPKMPPMHDGKGNRTITPPLQTEFQKISASVAQKDSDTETIMQLFPELKLTSEILIASIMSPNDMFTEELGFVTEDGLICQPIASHLISLTKNYFKQKRDLLAELPKILKESLFGPGSYAVAVLPENSVDDIINGSTSISRESLSHHMDEDGIFFPLGYLGSGKEGSTTSRSFSRESFIGNEKYQQTSLTSKNLHYRTPEKAMVALEYLFVTDNPDALKMPEIIKRRRTEQEMTLRSKRFGLEANQLKSEKLNDSQLTSLLYRNTQRRYSPMFKVKSSNELPRYSVGEPLVIKLPSESVIPVFPPGNPEKAVGYFVVLDSEGHPLSRKNGMNHFDGMRNFGKINKTNGDMSSFLIDKAATAFGGRCEDVTFHQAAQVYGEIVEADLLAKLRTGIYGSEVSISNNQEIYRIMLSRAMSKQNTQVLFVPKDMLTYFAYQFNDDGTGKSLLEDTRIISAMRAQMLFARVMGAVKNSIGRTKVSVEMSEDDPDARTTAEMVMAEVMAARQQVSPASTINPSDILNQVQTMGLEFEFTGGAGIPDTKIGFSETNSSYQKPDEDLEKDLRDRVISGVGVPPEFVDNANQPDFATTAIQSNLLMAKRVHSIQAVYVVLLSSYARMLMLADNNFMIELKETIKANLDVITKAKNVDPAISENVDNPALIIHMLAMEYLSNINVSLAKPDVKSLETQQDAIDLHDSIYDKVIKYFISSETLDASIIGEAASSKLAAMSGAAKAAYMRRWLATNGIMPEIFELTAVDDDGKPAFDIRADMVTHTQNIALSMLGMLKKTTPVAQAADVDINALGGDEAQLTSTTSNVSSNGGGEDTSTNSDTGGDFNFPDM